MSSDNTVPKADQDQATYENAAKARRVHFVNSSGESIKSTLIEANNVGADCSGVDGAANRVLTLTNTSETGNPVSVWIEGQLIAQSDLTISHLSASSTITFGIAVYDADAIRSLYYV